MRTGGTLMELEVHILTPTLFFKSAVSFGLFGLHFRFPLGLVLPADAFHKDRRAIVRGTSLFWHSYTFVHERVLWAGYYRFFCPEWMK